VWNNLLSQLPREVSYGQFKRQLKHFCLVVERPRRIVTVCVNSTLETLLLTYYKIIAPTLPDKLVVVESRLESVFS